MSPKQMTSVAIATSPLGLVGRWSTRSQEQARRNAMTACTVLAARRLERLEVEEYIASHLAHVSEAQHSADAQPSTATPIRHVS